MIRRFATALACLAVAVPAGSQAPQRPPVETRKVEGTENVYIFRNGNHHCSSSRRTG
jgi:hypothetical protein